LIANLAAAFALDGREVLLVDADLRRPSLHEVFGLENAAGLSSYLEEEGEGRVPLVPSGIERLRVMTSGPRVALPGELLGSPRVPRAIKRLAGMADLVLLDAAPVLVAADAAILARQLDACVLVVWEGRTRREAGARAKALLERAGAKLLGVILAR
jgi:capsular exopolysaccharide synthesis family protein